MASRSRGGAVSLPEALRLVLLDAAGGYSQLEAEGSSGEESDPDKIVCCQLK